jgi:hypothetical protein
MWHEGQIRFGNVLEPHTQKIIVDLYVEILSNKEI